MELIRFLNLEMTRNQHNSTVNVVLPCETANFHKNAVILRLL